jgi:hypothetical protein
LPQWNMMLKSDTSTFWLSIRLDGRTVKLDPASKQCHFRGLTPKRHRLRDVTAYQTFRQNIFSLAFGYSCLQNEKFMPCTSSRDGSVIERSPLCFLQSGFMKGILPWTARVDGFITDPRPIKTLSVFFGLRRADRRLRRRQHGT